MAQPPFMLTCDRHTVSGGDEGERNGSAVDNSTAGAKVGVATVAMHSVMANPPPRGHRRPTP